MPALILLLVLAALPASAAAQERLPAGWQMRLDRPNAPADNVLVEREEDGVRVTLGPSGIFYRPADRVRGAHRVRATFELLRAARHPEAYGLFVGGRNLDAAAQDYLYFLIRQDGSFSIRHRGGAEVHTLFGWTESPAVRRQEGSRPVRNTLVVESDAAGVRFRVNGVEVARLPRVSGLNTDGIVGLRVNHNLDLRVSDVEIEPLD
jgi:hypothetical protein